MNQRLDQARVRRSGNRPSPPSVSRRARGVKPCRDHRVGYPGLIMSHSVPGSMLHQPGTPALGAQRPARDAALEAALKQAPDGLRHCSARSRSRETRGGGERWMEKARIEPGGAIRFLSRTSPSRMPSRCAVTGLYCPSRRSRPQRKRNPGNLRAGAGAKARRATRSTR